MTSVWIASAWEWYGTTSPLHVIRCNYLAMRLRDPYGTGSWYLVRTLTGTTSRLRLPLLPILRWLDVGIQPN